MTASPARVVVTSHPGLPITLTIYQGPETLARVMLTPARALALAGELLSAGLPKIGESCSDGVVIADSPMGAPDQGSLPVLRAMRITLPSIAPLHLSNGLSIHTWWLFDFNGLGSTRFCTE